VGGKPPTRKENMKKRAKLYNELGWWKYYKTDDGHSFAIREGRHYYYNGNVHTNDKSGECYIAPDKLPDLLDKIEFVEH
jgi:hypothetical protein